jgi:hypothetical protein
MSAYDLQQLMRKWGREELTVEQMIGQIMQHLQELSDRIGSVEKQQETLRQQNGKD